jgi:uncharacterized protein (TIGR03032 family)
VFASPPASASPNEPAKGAGNIAIDFEYSLDLVPLLRRLNLSVLLTTYQANKLAVVGTDAAGLAVAFYHFDRPMGLAVAPDRWVLAARQQVWTLHPAPQVAPRVEPAGQYDGCFAARSSVVTGDIQVHEVALGPDRVWVVNTLFNCLCTLDERYSFVAGWQPPFVSALAAEDRCHLNGLAVVDGRPRYVTALGETDTPSGWRPGKAAGGGLIDVPAGRVVARGLSMPHSPRTHGGRIWVLESGRGHLSVVDPAAGRVEPVAALPGFTRGLAFHGGLAFVGLSRIRETATFGGLPLDDRRDALKCGLAVVDLASARVVGALEFRTGVEEIFDVQVVPGVRLPVVVGPDPERDGVANAWIVPDPARPATVSPS